MRTIKFRAWFDNEMIYENNLYGRTLVSKEFIFRFEKVMQFTGLKDKNGKEIYEGDILNFDGDIIQITLGTEVLTLGWKTLKYEDENVLKDIRLYRTDSNAKIIGNIYENPELMGEKQ